MKDFDFMEDCDFNENEVFMRARDVALKLNISRSQVYRLIQNAIIPSVRINHSVRVRPCDLKAFIQKNWSGRTEPSKPTLR